MKNFLTRIFKKDILSYNKHGISATTSDGVAVVVSWTSVEKIVMLDNFEEYSGYFLTEDHLSKRIYNDISISCSRNIVKIRTGGSPQVKKNTSEPFSKNFGTTSIYYPIFVEYIDDLGNKNLYANHFDSKNKELILNNLKSFLTKDKIIQKNKIEGFTPLSEL